VLLYVSGMRPVLVIGHVERNSTLVIGGNQPGVWFAGYLGDGSPLFFTPSQRPKKKKSEIEVSRLRSSLVPDE
jgi:hypothetical protein